MALTQYKGSDLVGSLGTWEPGIFCLSPVSPYNSPHALLNDHIKIQSVRSSQAAVTDQTEGLPDQSGKEPQAGPY